MKYDISTHFTISCFMTKVQWFYFRLKPLAISTFSLCYWEGGGMSGESRIVNIFPGVKYHWHNYSLWSLSGCRGDLEVNEQQRTSPVNTLSKGIV